MLSNTTLLLLGFINLFMIPIIGLKIYCHRHEIDWSFNSKTFYLYTLITILNVPLARILLNVVEMLFSISIHVETSKYTVIALVTCVMLPFILEIIELYFHVKVDISIQNQPKKDNKHQTIETVSEDSNEK